MLSRAGTERQEQPTTAKRLLSIFRYNCWTTYHLRCHV